MKGTIHAYFPDRGFGFITDEQEENRYFQVTKVMNPSALKVGADVIFKPITRQQGLGAVDIKVQFEAEHIFIADEKIKTTSISSYRVYKKTIPLARDIDDSTVVSIGLLMNRIRPETAQAAEGTTEVLTYLELQRFHTEPMIFTSHEIDIEEALDHLRLLPIPFKDER